MKRFLLLLIAPIVLYSCEKEIPLAELLAGSDAKAWRLDSRINNGVPEFLNDCEKAWVLEFRADGSLFGEADDDECPPNTLNGTWSFNAQETEVNITTGPDTETWEILELTASSFKFLREELGLEQEVGYVPN